MKNSLKFQFKNMLNSPGFVLSILFATLFSVTCFVINCVPWLGNDVINLPAAYMQYMSNGMNILMVRVFSIIFPLIPCVAYSDSCLSDLNSHTILPIISRCGKRNYYYSKLVTVFCEGFTVITFPQLLNLLFCVVAFPLESTNIYTWDLWQADTYTVVIKESFFLFKGLYIESPYLYFLFYILISGIVSGLVAVIAFQISFFVRNKIFVITFMFVLINLSSVYFSSRGLNFDICSYMFGYNAGGQNYRDFAILFIFYILAALIPSFYAIKRLNDCL